MHYIAATVLELKASRSTRGTFGKKRLHIIEQLKSIEKKIDSKVKYLRRLHRQHRLATAREVVMASHSVVIV